ncbi:transcription initiation factor TFIID subunit 4 isoform X5 [Lucilia cuprina]|uniref:transcription initiation factor TFIID subunit 4 isoform X5 n=1 Tax=Lucilia cuprina TaxID=7375 RepID=UPI001F05B4D3|nr:transcription initiation factor TFIID subunit 4 isoform X5 [Lucilia cuprina]
MNSSQPTQAAPGNRITFTSQALPNGTINIGSAHGGSIISTSQLPNTTTIKTITSSAAGQQHHTLPQQVQVQHHQVLQTASQQQGNPSNVQNQQQSVGATQTQTLVIKSNHAVSLPAGIVSSAPGIVTMTKTIQQGNQPLLNSIIPAGVVVGMRPPTAQQQPKNVQGNTVGRMVIGGPHMVGTRPQSPASISNTSTANSIVVNSVATSNSQPTYTSQSNISMQPHHTTTNVVASMQQHHQQQQQQQHHHQQQQQQQQFHQQTQHLQSQPQITQIQTIPAQQTNQIQQNQQQQQQQHHQTNTNNNTIHNNANSTNNISGSTTLTTTTTTPQSATAQGNTKEKCRKFLANLIDLSTREPKPVEKNVRNLIQELVNANVEPEEFCDRLERLLNASPQPCLIGFLKKSLPLLRQALFSKELVIEGIKPPPQHVVGGISIQQHLPKIQAHIRPISQNQTTTIGQTQVRMISPASATRPIGHTTITKQPVSGIRIQGPANGPRLLNTQIRGPVQQQTNATQQLQTAPTHANIVQIRTPTATQLNRPATVQIRTAKGKNTTTSTASPSIAHVKVGQTQIKAISSSPSPAISSQPPSLAAISNNVPTASSNLSSSASIISTINSVASNSMGSGTSLPVPSLPTVQLPPAVLAQQQQQQQQLINNANSLISTNTALLESIKASEIKNEIKTTPTLISNTSSSATSSSIMTMPPSSMATPQTPTTANRAPAKSSAASASKAAAKKKKDLADKEREEQKLTTSTSATSAASFFQQPSISMSSYGDDDINDVAAMGGVNLAEETQRILGCTENIGTQIRSCKDEVFLHLPALQARIRSMVMERGLEEPSQDVAVLISHACQERLKNIVEKLAVIAEHRIDVIKLDPRYEVTKDVRGQIKFLEELDKAEQKRHEELEREMLLRAAKSRSKVEDPEQAKMKARAKEMQRAEMEELRQRDANMTALQAIGPRKKLKLDSDGASSGLGSGINSVLGPSAAPAPLRPRIKRVNLRDMLFFMEQERETCRSQMLVKAYLK